MGAPETIASVTQARERTSEAITGLRTATDTVSALLGTGHDATQALHEARRAAEVARAKLDNLLRYLGRTK